MLAHAASPSEMPLQGLRPAIDGQLRAVGVDSYKRSQLGDLQFQYKILVLNTRTSQAVGLRSQPENAVGLRSRIAMLPAAKSCSDRHTLDRTAARPSTAYQSHRGAVSSLRVPRACIKSFPHYVFIPLVVWSWANIENFDEELFINEVKTYESIWNYKSEIYSDRIKKDGAWAAICETFVPEFNIKTVPEKNQIAKTLQKKWKVLRDGFNRYVSKSKKTKSGSGASQTRQYIYFHQMSFLLPLAKEKAETVNNLEDETGTESSVVITEEQQRGRKRASAAKEDNLIEQLSANLNKKYKENTSNHEADDDKLFLLSLHTDFKNISDCYKLDAKTDMLNILKKYKLLSFQTGLYPGPSQPIQPSYQQCNYEDFSRGHSTGPATSTYVQRTYQPGPTSIYVQRNNEPQQTTTRTEEVTNVLSPDSVNSQSSQSSIHSLFNM